MSVNPYNNPVETLCMATKDQSCDFKPMILHRRALEEYDVLIDMKYCGICHSDLHGAAGHLSAVGVPKYPFVPGHELSGVCISVGSKVTKAKIGDFIGVGCIIDSCLSCVNCLANEEQHCIKGSTGTYNGKNKHGRAVTHPIGTQTLGGYTKLFVVHEHFALIIPSSYPLECAGPVMCSGITLFDPLIKHGAKEGTRVGIVGLGGLGQMGVLLAKEMGCVVTVISRGKGKESIAKRRGSDSFISSTSPKNIDMIKAEGSLDLILNTIPIDHDYSIYTKLLSKQGKQVILGLNASIAAALVVNKIVGGRSRVVNSGIGGIKATQDVIDFCAKHKIYPSVEIVPVEEINKVYEKLSSNNDAGVRYVIDLEKSLNDDAINRCIAPAPHLEKHSGGLSSMGSIVGEICNMLCCCKWV